MKRDKKMPWTKPLYGRNAVNKAANRIKDGTATDEDYDIVNNKRSSYGYPLYLARQDLSHMTQGYEGAFVIYRLKRLKSIIGKLRRYPSMNLYTMQDTAGCRVVVKRVSDVYGIADGFDVCTNRFKFYREKDYIKEPKISGYRCLHRIYKYQGVKSDNPYNGLMIEVQFRTKLQHLWATAIETMGIYLKTNLKAGIGDERYLRFFALVSSLFALEECTPTVPNTSDNKDELLTEIKQLNGELGVLNKLRAVRRTTMGITRSKSILRKVGYYVLDLNYDTSTLTVKHYPNYRYDKAVEYCNNAEKTSSHDVVLVSAKSLTELKEAYPNYFGDIKQFVEKLTKVIEG